MTFTPANPYKTITDLREEDLRQIREGGIVAVDTETTGLNPHRDTLCLVQLCDSQGNVFFVKNKEWHNSPNLKILLSDDKVTKVFHFALFDCTMLLQHLDIETRNIYCTKIASKIVRTYSPEHSLSSLVLELLDMKLDKSQQSTDWFAESLTDKQLTYAANDVLWLVQTKSILDHKIKERGFLPSGLSYYELNLRCQAFIPTLIHLWLNGWDFGNENRASIFSH